MNVFVTVGTTKFDKLICTITEQNTLKVRSISLSAQKWHSIALKERGFNNLLIQIGNGVAVPNEENCKISNINLSYYKYKNSINEDILKADLVISHAGAGTCLEVLAEKKPLLVVVNEELMHNHQTELADQLSSEKYLFACTCASLVETIKNINFNDLKKMPPPQENVFASYLDQLMGFHNKR